MTDEQILAAVGRAYKKFLNTPSYCPVDPGLHAGKFLDSLIPVEKEVRPWNPMELKYGDKYWTVDNGGEAFSCTWLQDGLDKWRRAIGACHPTKAAAEAWYRKLMNN